MGKRTKVSKCKSFRNVYSQYISDVLIIYLSKDFLSISSTSKGDPGIRVVKIQVRKGEGLSAMWKCPSLATTGLDW